MHTKAAPAIALLQGRRTLPVLEAYFELHQLKHLYRQGWLRAGISRTLCESVAEPSFFVALLCLFIADSCYPEVDTSKLVRMALLHCYRARLLMEILTGWLIGIDEDERAWSRLVDGHQRG